MRGRGSESGGQERKETWLQGDKGNWFGELKVQGRVALQDAPDPRGRAVADELTQLLRRWNRGEQDALGELLPLVYADLRRLARGALRRERPDHTLQPTALVHEAFLRLVPQQAKDWQNREQFFAVCAGLMRQVLVDHARRRRARKRGSGALKVALDEAGEAAARRRARRWTSWSSTARSHELEEIDGPRARVVEMRYFAGMTVPGDRPGARAAPEWDVKKDWKLAKAWLARRLKEPA